MRDGFITVAVATPEVAVADCVHNAQATAALIQEAAARGVKVLVFPELGLTAYTCSDLFLQPTLLRGAEAALGTVLEATRGKDLVAAVGLPVSVGGCLYNCAALCQNGRILGLVPKVHVPNYSEFYEKRHFAPPRRKPWKSCSAARRCPSAPSCSSPAGNCPTSCWAWRSARISGCPIPRPTAWPWRAPQ